MHRIIAVVVVTACSDAAPGGSMGDASPTPDDDPCDRPPPALPAECVPDGLAGIDLNGTWTLTGMARQDIAGMMSERVVDEPRTLRRDGGGWCRFGQVYGTTAPMLDPLAYVDDSWAMRPYERSFDGRSTFKYQVCKRASDGALVYLYEAAGYAQQKPYTEHIEGVLTR